VGCNVEIAIDYPQRIVLPMLETIFWFLASKHHIVGCDAKFFLPDIKASTFHDGNIKNCSCI